MASKIFTVQWRWKVSSEGSSKPLVPLSTLTVIQDVVMTTWQRGCMTGKVCQWITSSSFKRAQRTTMLLRNDKLHKSQKTKCLCFTRNGSDEIESCTLFIFNCFKTRQFRKNYHLLQVQSQHVPDSPGRVDSLKINHNTNKWYVSTSSINSFSTLLIIFQDHAELAGAFPSWPQQRARQLYLDAAAHFIHKETQCASHN